MTEADRIFSRFPEFIREYIFTHRWESLRAVQVAAARTLFLTDHHLLLTSSTASGKTEAAFFPILSELYQSPPESVGALYIAPLKSLINDQFGRMEELLDLTGIPVTRWHGDVAQSHKKKLLTTPRGILQITPESLEAMLINRSNDMLRLFGDLRYIVIDEIHTLTGTDRGNQIICQLARLGHLIGRNPRRVGTNLKRIRTVYGCSQAELSRRSGVSLRSIQMYEQRNKDINKASAETVHSLAKILGCTVEDLLENRADQF